MERLISCSKNCVSVILRLLLISGLGVTLARGADPSAPPLQLPVPPMPSSGPHSGTVTLQVAFNSSGDVASCRVLKSCGFPGLDQATAHFVKSRWHAPRYAGQTIEVPICYQPFSLPYGTPVVPNLLLPGEPSVSLRLWVSFDSDGYVKDFGVFQGSGYEKIQHRFLSWISAHWRTKDYPHQTVNVQLDFEAPQPAAKTNSSDGPAK